MERWVWTDLLAFDNGRADFGVAAYVGTTGFVPAVVCLMIASPDIVLQHEGLEKDALFPPDFCSRHGHKGNENRERQEWSRYQLRDLVGHLQAAGSRVYLSNFCCSLQDRFHREWVSDYPEAKVVLASEGRLPSLFVLARFKDGTYVRDYFAKQLVRACIDYGFDGWHGADCFGPHSPIFDSACCDDMTEQFIMSGQRDLPEVVTAPSCDLPEKLLKRIEWIWTHKRLEWIRFQADQWADFWRIVSSALHAIGRQTAINSAWTRDPFQALYRYGIDYRTIASAGVDHMIVETVAGSLMLGSNDRDYHYDLLAMLMHIKACVPDTSLIFLHPIKDVVECWDLLRHNAPMLEREIHALCNVYHTQPGGQLHRCADGLLACLADGISPEEWTAVRRHWEIALDVAVPLSTAGASLIWTDSILDRHLADYPTSGDCSSHYLTYRLLEAAAPIQSTLRVDTIPDISPDHLLLILHPHLLTDGEKAQLLESPNPLIAIGSDFRGWPEPACELVDTNGARSYYCRVYNSTASLDLWKAPDNAPAAREAAAAPAADLGISEPVSFRQELYYVKPSEEFFQRCAELIRRATGSFSLTNSRENAYPTAQMKVGIMMTESAPGRYRLIVKNSDVVYAHPCIDIHRPIEHIEVRGSFPILPTEFEGSRFTVVVPPRGVVVMDIMSSP